MDEVTRNGDVAAMREALRVQTDLVGRLCEAVDREAEDIGGESSLSVLRLLGPHHATAVAVLSPAPDRGEVDSEFPSWIKSYVGKQDAETMRFSVNELKIAYEAGKATIKPADATPASEAVQMALRSIREWVASLTVTDMNEIVADGGITAGMLVGQEAVEQLRRLDAALKSGEGKA